MHKKQPLIKVLVYVLAMLTNVATDKVSAVEAGKTERTRRPMVTGSSVLGLKYKDGVMLAADTLASYGSLAKYKDARRIVSVNPYTLVGGGGEFSDFQYVTEMLKRNALEDKCTADSLYDEENAMECAREVWNYLRAVMYHRRNKMNPLWNELLIAGFDGDAKGAGDKAGSERGVPFLGYVDKIGTTYEEDFIATGFGSYMAIPLLRDKWRPDLEEGEARALLEDCCRVLFYRDCRALNRIQIAKVTTDGVLVSDPFEIDTNWDAPSFSLPTAGVEGDGGW